MYVDPVVPINLVQGIYCIACWVQTASIHVEGSPASEKTQSCWKQNKALIKCLRVVENKTKHLLMAKALIKCFRVVKNKTKHFLSASELLKTKQSTY